MEHQAAGVVVTPHAGGGLKQSRWWLLIPDFRIALVGGDDEVVLFGQFDELYQFLQGVHRPGGIGGAAKIEQLGAIQQFGWQFGEAG